MANEVDNYLTIKGSAEDIAKIYVLFSESEVIDEDLVGRSFGQFSRFIFYLTRVLANFAGSSLLTHSARIECRELYIRPIIII